ncbi:hypothetical protein, partial [Salmonella enterica]|uniref:hypothetical protein n=1 Tax=Salmonella enterica TaxID=28901 RepID=UPI0019615E84
MMSKTPLQRFTQALAAKPPEFMPFILINFCCCLFQNGLHTSCLITVSFFGRRQSACPESGLVQEMIMA